MPRINYHAKLKCLVAVGGHRFDRNAFDAMFQSMDGISATMVDQPAAALLMNPEGMRAFDVLVLYDMPGLDFDGGACAPVYQDPDPHLKKGFLALLEQGIGIVGLHHAIAGWPTWEEYHQWLGGQFFYHPGSLRGEAWPDSGYRHDVDYEVEVSSGHPVTAGLPSRFAITDELYLNPTIVDDAMPLLTVATNLSKLQFWSSESAVQGIVDSNEGWSHPLGSGVVAWAKQVKASRLVYLQPGDGPSVFENPNYRRLLENSLWWVARETPPDG